MKTMNIKVQMKPAGSSLWLPVTMMHSNTKSLDAAGVMMKEILEADDNKAYILSSEFRAIDRDTGYFYGYWNWQTMRWDKRETITT